MRRALLLALAAASSGCLGWGVRYDQFKETAPTIEPGLGRIYFYRSDYTRFIVQPVIRIDGKPAITPVPGRFFFVDLPPGPHRCAAKLEEETQIDLVVPPGGTAYVAVAVSTGVWPGRVRLEAKDRGLAEREMASTRYVPYEGPEETAAAVAPPSLTKADVPPAVLAQCADFGEFVEACHPSESAWWVVYRTASGEGVEGYRTAGVFRKSRRGGWRRQIDSNRREARCARP